MRIWAAMSTRKTRVRDKIGNKAFQEYSFHFFSKNFILAANALAVDAQSITETSLWLKEFPSYFIYPV